MSYGFVYVLSNESMPGIYKIGFTTKHPRERMGELSRATACPTPFDLAAYFGTECPAEIEAKIHRDLDSYRVNKSREFFKAPAEVLLDAIDPYWDDYSDAVLTRPLRTIAYIEEFEANDQWPIDYFFQQSADPIFWQEKFRGFE